MEAEKLKNLLNHWIEHNEEHISKYKEWAQKIREDRRELSDLIVKSITYFERGNEILKKAMEMI